MKGVPIGMDASVRLTCQDDAGAAVNLSAATLVSVAAVSFDGLSLLAGPYTASSGATGANWSAGIVAVTIPSAATASLPARVRFQVRAVIAGVPSLYVTTADLLTTKVWA